MADVDSPTRTKLCSTLDDIFGNIACSTPTVGHRLSSQLRFSANILKESFTSLPNDRFYHATSFQYFQPLENLSPFIRYAKTQLCPSEDATCTSRLESLAKASSLDISYDTISHALKITALWPYQSRPINVTAHRNVRTEVGVLSDEKTPTMEDHELGISGLLTVLGQDSKPSTTMFAFPSRHRDAQSTFSVQFLSPTGLHPALQLQLSSDKPPMENTFCSPHAYFTLPKGIFADKYQLSDDLFLAAKNLTALRYISQPVDLEAPEYVMKLWGSSVLLELAPPQSGEKGQPWTAEIPLHLRYLLPTFGGFGKVEVPYPAVFWACAAEEGTKFPTNPFERVNLGYDGLFGPRTVFWHVEPQPRTGSRVTTAVKVPVLDLDKAGWVNVGTAAVVLAGFLWVTWKLISVYMTSGYGNPPRTPKAVEKKKQ